MKSSMLAALLLLSSSAFAADTVDTGSVVRNHVYHPEGPWLLGTAGEDPEIPYVGGRTYTVRIKFSKRFSSIPTVTASLSSLDLNSSTNTRVGVSVANVTMTGFTLVIETWDNSVTYGVGAQWIAVGNRYDPPGKTPN